jgi:membrane-bound metal-dependent hydrolase YbcI (DUF457 family)
MAESAIMTARMPSPIGHALAGVAVVWAADLADGHRSSPRLVATCAGLAMLPDVDLVLRGTHRMATHSLIAAAAVFIVAALVTRQVTPRRPGCQTPQRHDAGGRHLNAATQGWRIALVCALAYASHLFLDWLGADRSPPRGLQLLWPFSDRWLISDWDVFRQTARQHFLTAPILWRNTVAVAQELAILLPIVLGLWLVRVKTAPRFSTELAGSDHPAQ